MRERFIADRTVLGYTAKTPHDYLRSVSGFAAFLDHSPSIATAEDIRRFQIKQSGRGINAPAVNSAVAALRFFFNHTVRHRRRGVPIEPGSSPCNRRRSLAA